MRLARFAADVSKRIRHHYLLRCSAAFSAAFPLSSILRAAASTRSHHRFLDAGNGIQEVAALMPVERISRSEFVHAV